MQITMFLKLDEIWNKTSLYHFNAIFMIRVTNLGKVVFVFYALYKYKSDDVVLAVGTKQTCSVTSGGNDL